MKAARISDRALKDLAEIWDIIAEDSPLNADKFIAELVSLTDFLTERPFAGRARTDLGRRYRSFPHGRYLLIYSVEDPLIIIHRFIHGARDLRKAMRNKK